MVIETSTPLPACPFCGEEAYAHQSTYIGEGQLYWVKCQNESCKVSPRAATTLTEAVESWRRRAA
jgi:hypothetical protein